VFAAPRGGGGPAGDSPFCQSSQGVKKWGSEENQTQTEEEGKERNIAKVLKE